MYFMKIKWCKYGTSTRLLFGLVKLVQFAQGFGAGAADFFQHGFEIVDCFRICADKDLGEFAALEFFTLPFGGCDFTEGFAVFGVGV